MSIEVIPINGFIGAELRGVDLSRLDDAAFKTIHDALVQYEVLVIAGQARMTLEQQTGFGNRFGPLTIHPFAPNLPDKPEVIVLDYSADHPAARTDIWHADETYKPNPPIVTILRSRVIPARGGDTCFSSMTAAYRGLSERMKQHIHGLEAQHDFKPWRNLFDGSAAQRAQLRQLEEDFPNPWHPLVRVHPVSGRRVLYVNPQFCVRIRGTRGSEIKDDESHALLQFLYEQAHIPEYQLRVKWQPDMVVLWDNRSLQHYAPHDYYPQRRTMERVTVEGDVPAGVSGEYTPETVAGNGVVNPSGPPLRPPVRQFERAA